MALSKLPLSTIFFFFLYTSLLTISQVLSSKIAVAQIKDQQDLNEPFVGINIGVDVSNLMSATELVSLLQFQKVTHIRLYDADPDMLKALAKTKIRVIISVPNNQLIAIGSSNATAASWIAPLLVPAIESLYDVALEMKGIKLIIAIQISTLIHIRWITIKQLKLIQRSTNLFKSPDLISEWIVNPVGFLLRNPNINTHLLKIFNLKKIASFSFGHIYSIITRR